VGWVVSSDRLVVGISVVSGMVARAPQRGARYAVSGKSLHLLRSRHVLVARSHEACQGCLTLLVQRLGLVHQRAREVHLHAIAVVLARRVELAQIA
jgi:hypothetical protein